MNRYENMKTNEFAKDIESLYPIVSLYELLTLRKLINFLKDDYIPNSDWSKLSIKQLEENNPYWLLERKKSSPNVFLLYKKILNEEYKTNPL